MLWGVCGAALLLDGRLLHPLVLPAFIALLQPPQRQYGASLPFLYFISHCKERLVLMENRLLSESTEL